MIVIPLDTTVIVQLVILSLVFEIVRILVGFLIGKPPRRISTLEKDKRQTQQELADIKSLQLELVKHSLLTRRIIKIDKEIEKLNSQQQPKAKAIKSYSRIIRAIMCIGVGIYFFNHNIIMVNPMLLWPVSWFTSKSLIQLPAWFILAVCCMTWRHILRTFIHVTFRSTTFP